MDGTAELLAAALRIATPLLFAALGGILSERAGVFAVGLEGMMLAGAFAGVIATHALGHTGLGLIASAVGGAALAAIVAVATVRFYADQMVTGLAVNILALGVVQFLAKLWFGAEGSAAAQAYPAKTITLLQNSAGGILEAVTRSILERTKENTGATLILARGFQGIAGALLVPGSLALLSASIRAEDRSVAIGAWSGLSGVWTAIGPFAGVSPCFSSASTDSIAV